MRFPKYRVPSVVVASLLSASLSAQISVTVPFPTLVPTFTLPSIAPAGPPVTSSYFTGRIGVIEFWFPRCGYCGPMHDALARVAGAYGPESVRILAVDIDREANLTEALEWLDDHQPTPFPVVLDTMGFAEAMRVHGAPFFAIVDHQGLVVHWFGGVDLDTALPPILDRYLALRRTESSQGP